MIYLPTLQQRTWTATSGTGVTFSNTNAQNPTVTFANAGTYTISLIAKMQQDKIRQVNLP